MSVKIFFLVGLLSFPSLVVAQNMLYDVTYPADEQVSGCEIRHILYDNSAEQISMLWVAEKVCAGDVQATEQVMFSKNSMQAWPKLLNKVATWGDQAMVGAELPLHHWGSDITVKGIKSEDILGEMSVVFSMQNISFHGDLQKPLRIDVSGNQWQELADKIHRLSFR